MNDQPESSSELIPGFVARSIHFLKRQQRDWKVTVARTSMDKLAYQMVFPYLSVYIVALGASATQLGMVNSIGMVIAGLFGPFTGWFIDRIGPKKIYLVGISFMAIYVFLAFICIELLVRMPLLITLPETLNKKLSSKEDAVSGT